MSQPEGPVRVDVLIRDATIVTMDPQRRIITHGAVAIDKGRIAAVGKSSEVEAAYAGKETIDAHRSFWLAHDQASAAACARAGQADSTAAVSVSSATFFCSAFSAQ